VEHRADRAERLGQDRGGAAVQEPVRLAVPLDRHPRDHPVRGGLEHVDAHAVAQFAGGEQLVEVHARTGEPVADLGGKLGHLRRLHSCPARRRARGEASLGPR
jgi:hypothetical protein